MSRWIISCFGVVALLASLVTSPMVLRAWLPSPGVQDLPEVSIHLGGEVVDARVADTPDARAQGFQHASVETLRSELILFTWPGEDRPSFHMEHVAAPLVIAWIDDGRVIDMAHMQPGQDGYRPPDPVDAALELAPHKAEELGIAAGTRVRMPQVAAHGGARR